MKIVIVGTAYPLRGGIAHFNALLARYLSKHHSVETVTFKRQYPRLLFPGKTQDERGPSQESKAAPQLIDSVNPLNWVKVANTISRGKPDLLIFKYWMPFFAPCFGTIAKRVKRKTGAKVLFICDNVIPHERRPGDAVLTRYAFKQVDFFIVQSDAVEEELKKTVPNAKYAKVPHPVYEIFGPGLGKQEARRLLNIKEGRVILFFGYVRSYKGLHTLIEAMPSVLHELGVQLLIVGEFYEDERVYRDAIRQLGVEASVTVVADYVPNDRVRLYFSAADVVVLPYVSATQSGIVQIAYNFSKPVISTNVGGLPEVVRDGETGFLVPPEDPQALAAAIVRFYREDREAEFSRRVGAIRQEYSWDALVGAVETLVKNV